MSKTDIKVSVWILWACIVIATIIIGLALGGCSVGYYTPGPQMGWDYGYGRYGETLRQVPNTSYPWGTPTFDSTITNQIGE